MERRQDDSRFVRRAMAAGWLEGSRLSLLDIGASGGIAAFWNQFRPRLAALGVDPLQAEVDRLNAAEPDAAVRYLAAWVGAPDPVSHPEHIRTMHGLTSSWRAQRRAARSYTERVFNSGAPVIHSDRHVTVDALVAGGDCADPDVLKIDVDGLEAEVLDGAAATLREGRLLLLECECGFHDRINYRWRGFAEVDRLLRDAGYRLLDLDPHRYSRGALPDRFAYDMPAQTRGGQVSFCDAVWILDPSVDEAAFDRLRPDPAKFAKLVLLLEAYGYPDVAAAVLLRLRETGPAVPGLDPTAALDWLVPQNPFGATTHEAYLAAFDADPARFTPSGWAAAEAAASAARLRPLPEVLEGSAWQPAHPAASVEGHWIRTPAAPWGYGAALPIRAEALPEDGFVIEITAELRRGSAYATLATPDHQAIGEQFRLGAGSGILRLPGSRATGRTHILLRNGEQPEPAEIEVLDVRCLG